MVVPRPAWDLQQLWNTNFVFGTVNTLASVGGDALTEKPPILQESTYTSITPPALTDNCLIAVFQERVGKNQNFGDFRHHTSFIDGYIFYESRTDKTDEMIHAIFSHLRSILNINNDGATPTYHYEFITSLYNEVPISGRIDFVVEATEKYATAVT